MTNNQKLSAKLRHAIAPVALVVESLQHRDEVADEEDTLRLAVRPNRHTIIISGTP